MESIHPIVRAVIIKDNNILLSSATPKNDRFSNEFKFLPGGHVEYLETSSEALKRELYEETTGLGKIEVMELLGILECTWDNKGTPYHEINIVYRVEFETMCELIQSNEEHIEFKWYRLDLLNDLKILPGSLAELIPLWLSSNEKNNILASEMNSIQTDLL